MKIRAVNIAYGKDVYNWTLQVWSEWDNDWKDIPVIYHDKDRNEITEKEYHDIINPPKVVVVDPGFEKE